MMKGFKLSHLMMFIIICAISMLWSGYILIVLWDWFLVPLKIMSLNMHSAVGISLIVMYLTWQSHPNKEENPDVIEFLITAAVYAVIKPLFVLVLGFAAHTFLQ